MANRDVPLRRFYLAQYKRLGQVELRICIALVRRFTKPERCIVIVLVCPLAIPVCQAKGVLPVAVSQDGRSVEVRQGRGEVLVNSITVSK